MDAKEREDYEKLCSEYLLTFMEVEMLLMTKEYKKAQSCLNHHARKIDDMRLGLSETGEVPLRLYEEPGQYRKMYLLLFNAITNALEMMYEHKYDKAAAHLILAQRKAERIFLDNGEACT